MKQECPLPARPSLLFPLPASSRILATSNRTLPITVVASCKGRGSINRALEPKSPIQLFYSSYIPRDRVFVVLPKEYPLVESFPRSPFLLDPSIQDPGPFFSSMHRMYPSEDEIGRPPRRVKAMELSDRNRKKKGHTFPPLASHSSRSSGYIRPRSLNFYTYTR